MNNIEYTCYKCREKSEFDPRDQVQLFVEYKTYDKPNTYVVDCPNCGAQNSVEVSTNSNYQ